MPLRRYKAKRVKTRSLQEWVGHFEPKFQWGRGRPWGIFFGFYKTRHILLFKTANCTVPRAVVLTQYRRVTDRWTDRQTDGSAIASTELAMRALWRAVKMTLLLSKCKLYLLLDEDALALQADNLLLLLTKITYRCTRWLRIKYPSEVFDVIIIGKDFRTKFPDFKKECLFI